VKTSSHILLLAATLLASAACTAAQDDNLTKWVDTKIGTGGHGHVFVGANVPFGMVQLGPTSIPQQWDWCSGYHESDSTVIGFSHTHLSGTGIGDLFDVTVMPVVGSVTYVRGTEDAPESGLWSYGDRTREVSVPGYYSIPLERYGVLAELTATERVGMHRYTFPESDDAGIVFDLINGGCWDKATATHIRVESDRRISGWRHSTGWAKNQKVFFTAEVSEPFLAVDLIDGEGHILENLSDDASSAKFCRLRFRTSEGQKILLKVALSPVSVKGSALNLEAELPGWDFDGTVRAANDDWNRELGKVRIADGRLNGGDKATADAKTCFYTALYHTMVAPSLFCDVNGDYRGADGEVRRGASYMTRTTFSLWDTYRAQMPLMTLLHREKMPDIINTMLAICDEQCRLPVWHLWGNETDCMVGNPGIPVVADAIVKEIPGFDRERAFEAILKTAEETGRGGELRDKYGYIPCDLMSEAVAYDMEYALADGAAALAAEALGKKAEAERFRERGRSWRHYFDGSTGFIRGRDSRGGWRTPFNPFSSEHRADDYCEGNAWQYTWLVPHDIPGLQDCFGSRERMLGKLDSLFTVSSVIEGAETSPDISGLIGQYAHGNEPSHHILYIYSMLGQPHKTADLVHRVLTELYHPEPDGLSGNEDVGQMSAWYVLSSMGLYEVEPGSGRYWFGTPAFESVTLDLDAQRTDGDTALGDSFTIRAEGLSSDSRHIHSVRLNGIPHDKPYIDYRDIVRGGELTFEMTADLSQFEIPKP